jgi:DNA repair protein RecO (recombination protein O)
MSLLTTPAIVLAAWRYGETSKIVRLATESLGVQGVIAKGALRPRSRFGAALQVLSGGTAHILHRDTRDLHILSAFDLQHLPVRLTRDVGRYATGTVLAELMLRVAPAEPHPEAFAVLRSALERLEQVEAEALEAEALASVWSLVAALGFAPAVDRCVRDGRPIEPGAELAWSLAEGGALCPRCARGTEVTVLPPEGAESLRRLVAGALPLPSLDPRHAAAHRRLVARYIRHHLGEGAPLAALEFWQQRAWAPA